MTTVKETNAFPQWKNFSDLVRLGSIILGTLCVSAITTWGQLHRFPVQRNSDETTATQRETRAARTKQDLLTLPFWDDFSKSHKHRFPQTSLWLNSLTIWVNNGMGINPPSINIATFDGLDSTGVAYSTQILQNGFTDSLVSKRIDLSEPEVSVAERGSVYLSFFFQWKGNGEAPDPTTDYLQVEFRNSANKWETSMVIRPKTSYQAEIFYDTIVQVSGSQFFHSAFQFRFRAFGRQSGPYDTWNIDYVYLNKGRNANDLSFPDQAIASSLTGLFMSGYRAMPYLHFKAQKSVVKPKFDIYNLRKSPPDVLTYLTSGRFFNYKDGVTTQTFISNLGGTDTTGINDDGTGIIMPFEKRTASLKYLPNVNDQNQFDPQADSITIDLKVHVFTGDYINHKNGQIASDYDLNYLPMDLRINDTIRATYTLKDYYAYDDGHAEFAAGLIRPGNLLAYEFELPSNVADTLALLESFDIYFPPYSLTSNQTIDFFVYEDNDGKPGDQLLQIFSKSIVKKGIDEFQNIKILPPLQIENRKFYIGWKQPVSGNALVGLDISNDTGNKMFVNTNGFWYVNDEVVGSLMLRPKFVSGKVTTIVGIDDEKQFSIYPNPSKGLFYIEGKYESLKIYSLTGREVALHSEIADNKTIITLDQPEGLYLLRCYGSGVLRTYKIVVTR